MQCQKFKAIRNTPIVIYTSLGSAEDELFSFKVGADDYIAKPSSIDVIRARLAKFQTEATIQSEKPIYHFEDWTFDTIYNW